MAVANAQEKTAPRPLAAATAPGKTALQHLAAATIAVAATVLMTWPLARDAGDHVLAAIYHWDAYTNAMIMGSRVDAVLGRGPLSVYDNYFFAPLRNSIVFNENLFGLSLIFAPLYLITESPLWAYNVTLLSSLSLSVFFTYLLVRRLTGSGLAGVLAGLGFAFSPYVMFELGRIQLVSTQWIPACFLMLHRALEGRRLRDRLGFWICYLLQLGTCLYYAMFLVPLLALVGSVLLVRIRPPRRRCLEFAAVGALAGVVALAMVHPYLSARDTFDFERSLSFASSYDGKLGFFANVHDTNRTLSGMHHRSGAAGAHEEIAFPGFTVLAMLLVSLGVPLWRVLRHRGSRAIAGVVGRLAAIAAVTTTAALFAHSLLVGAAVMGLGMWQQVRSGGSLPFSGRRGLYLAALLLSIVMFLGIAPMEFQGTPVRGLYYYFHTYVPGFNGIRKVSRQAVMTTFLVAILASFGSAWLFAQLSRPWAKALALCSLLSATVYELRCFPHPSERVWAGTAVPAAYRFLASLPAQDLVAAIPQNTGIRRFRGDRGLTLHNYLMLYHKHRSLNGQSSWQPPVSELVNGALSRLPDDGARRILLSLRARHIVVHAEDLEPRQRDLPERLAAQPEHYRRVFQQGMNSVFSLVPPSDPTLALVDVPPLPAGARPIPRRELRATANLRAEQAQRAVDGEPRTYWSGGRTQVRGQSFELSLEHSRPIVAFEIANPSNLTHVPLSFELSVARGESGWQIVAEVPVVRIYRELIYSPKTFVFRVVLPKPELADRVRLRVRQPVPGRPLTIHEARLYTQQP